MGMIEEETRPLFEQMTARRFRRLPWMGRLVRFNWFLYLPALGATFVLGFELGREGGTGDPKYKLVLLAGTFFALLFGGGWLRPSAMPAWLRNTARRGFLRDLFLARLRLRPVWRCHFVARAAPGYANLWLLLIYFLGDYSGFVSARRYTNSPFNDALPVLGAFLLGLVFLWDCDGYHRAWRGMFPWAAKTAVVVLAYLLATLIVVSLYFHLADYPNGDYIPPMVALASATILGIAGLLGYGWYRFSLMGKEEFWAELVRRYLEYEDSSLAE